MFLQNRSQESRIHYTKQKKNKKRYYKNLNEKSVLDSKLFLKRVKPLLCDSLLEIDLIENNKLVKTDLETVEILINFFSQYNIEP